MHNLVSTIVWSAGMWPFGLHTEESFTRLITAAILGGAIGLERELKHRPAGLRTNLFICFGSALFTILSDRLAGPDVADRTRIAAQIITGIGFIGAGTILHEKGSVSGLTSAASIFVVAGIGMAAGGGLYGTAVIAAVLVIVALIALGAIEERFNLKPITKTYDVIVSGCDSPESFTTELNRVLELCGLTMQTVHMAQPSDKHCKLDFTVEAIQSKHKVLEQQIKELPGVLTMASAMVADRD
jgi:putative Mg2+ transporter-C (MgtC) family protein